MRIIRNTRFIQNLNRIPKKSGLFKLKKLSGIGKGLKDKKLKGLMV
jgi:hypothetical protein